MVFFTCDHCGSAVKKSQVESHYFKQCRGKPIIVSCMDCSKEFRGKSFDEHTKCVSEEEKYSGKDYQPKPSSNTNIMKQELWMEAIGTVQHKGESLTKQDLIIIEKIKSLDNVPLKLAKFKNFIKSGNYVRGYPEAQVENLWKICEKEYKKRMEAVRPNDKVNESKNNGSIIEEDKEEEKESDELNGHEPQVTKLSKKERKEKLKKEKYEAQLKEIENEPNEMNEEAEEEVGKEKRKKKSKKNKMENVVENGGAKHKKNKKRKLSESGEEVNSVVENHMKKKQKHIAHPEENGNINGAIEEKTMKMKFKWDKTIIDLLSSLPDKEMAVKKLRKKIVAEFMSQEGSEDFEQAVLKFNKKIEKIPGVVVLKERARLKNMD